LDLNSLFYQHQVALLELAQASGGVAKCGAGARVDHFAARIAALRSHLGVASPTFHFRQLAAAW